MTWYEIFPQILNMSLTASVIICVVLLCRLMLKRAPKIYSYILWSVVIFRLLCPVSFSAPISVLGIFDTPVMEQTLENMDDKGTVTSTVAYIPTDIVHTEYPEITLPIPGVGDMVSDAVNEKLPWGEEQLGADPLEFPVTFATYLWIIGIMGMLISGLVFYVRLRGNMVGSLHLQDNVYVTDYIPGPLVVGMIKPKIYLPSDLDEKEHSYIILHEKQHIRRGDPIFKMVAYIALCIHWFNPLVWLFFKLFVKDMEMSCDEAVIQKMGESIRADYSASLLQLATGRRMLFGSPLAFGETEPTGRIKNLSKWKKPTIAISAFAIVLCIIAVIVSIFNPAVSKDTLRMIDENGPVMGKIVKYEVNFGKQVKEANIYAEVWEKGECEIIACLPVDQKAKVLSIQMKDRRENGKMAGVDIRLESDVPGGMQVTYAELPEKLSAIGWAFNAYEEGDTVDAISGEEKILAAMVFDTGEGVRVFDLETLLKEPSRLEKAEYMLVIRAVFEEEGQKGKLEPAEYEMLKGYFKTFLQGGQTGEQGIRMAKECQEIIAGMDEELFIEAKTLHGQEWFQLLYGRVKSLEKRYTEEELQKEHPAACILLEVEQAFIAEYGELPETESEINWQEIMERYMKGLFKEWWEGEE